MLGCHTGGHHVHLHQPDVHLHQNSLAPCLWLSKQLLTTQPQISTDMFLSTTLRYKVDMILINVSPGLPWFEPETASIRQSLTIHMCCH